VADIFLLADTAKALNTKYSCLRHADISRLRSEEGKEAIAAMKKKGGGFT
jgi:hypothetical protein